MTAKKVISRSSAEKNDGKKGPNDQLQDAKLTVKYTFDRSKEDIKNLEKLRQHLRSEFYKSYNADSKIYRDLPKLYLNAVKRNQDLELIIDELTAKLDQLEDLRASFCRIFEICEVKK
jgi:transposase